MGRFKIGVLTSSRADFSIYLPILKRFEEDDLIELKIIAFGSHTSRFHGKTKASIENAGFKIDYEIDTLPENDKPIHIVKSQGETFKAFAELWSAVDFDIVFCLGDRYEMFSAVLSTVPFGIKIAHIHGGETSLGAIDNIFRHSISLASKLHFVSCKDHKLRLEQLLDDKSNVFVVGAPALDNVNSLSLFSQEEFNANFNVDFTIPTILATIHPETVSPNKNANNIEQFIEAISSLDCQVLITKANADTMGNLINEKLDKLANSKANIILKSSLGPIGYYSALKHSKLVIGNSSSGLIETASFKKYCLNIGERQRGRKQGENIINVPFDKNEILIAIENTLKLGNFEGKNIFDAGGAAPLVSSHTKAFLLNK